MEKIFIKKPYRRPRPWACLPCRQAQSLVEYTLFFGVLVSLLIAISPLAKRGIQGMVKIIADQVGNQKDAEQDRDRKLGHLVNSYAITRTDIEKNTREQAGVTRYTFRKEDLGSVSEVLTNLGFTEKEVRVVTP